jgi:hypothetical protein
VLAQRGRWEHHGAVGQGKGGLEGRRDLAKVGKLITCALVLVVGLAWVRGDGSSTSEPTALWSQRTASDGDQTSASEADWYIYDLVRVSPSQPAIRLPLSAGIVLPAPATARIIDPHTGEEVVIPLPPGTTVIDGEVVPVENTGTTGPGGTATTRPGTGTTGTTHPSTTQPPTTVPPTTEPPTTEPPTTQPPTTEPPTTEPPTTEPPTTEPPTTQPPPP